MFAVIILWLKNPPEGALVSLIIVLGYVLAAIDNIIVNVWCLVLLLLRKPLLSHIPAWLVITNFLFLIPQLILFLK